MNAPANHDPQAELATLASCLMSRPARDAARKHVTGRDFYVPVHEEIWEAFGVLDRDRIPVDASSLLLYLSERSPQAVAVLTQQLVTWPASPAGVDYAAERVRKYATRRRLHEAGIRLTQQSFQMETDPGQLAATAATVLQGIRDSGHTADAESVTLGELLESTSVENDAPDWVVPGLMERRDRFMLTGEEGLGKSFLARQIAVMAAAGLDPWDPGQFSAPMSALIVDCENTTGQVRRLVRPVVEFARRYGSGNPGNVNLLCSTRMDLTSDRDLSRVHREMDACQPDLVVIGPLYRLIPRAINTDDEAAPLLAALDTLRDRGAALIIEAHAGHGTTGKHTTARDLRPRGSSALLGWPEFGYGMRQGQHGVAELVPWRGDRAVRDWPEKLRHCDQGIRWVPAYVETRGQWGA